MAPQPLILRSRVTPPRPRRRLLPRPALHARLRDALDYPVTLVQAGTGYGKTTALAALAAGPEPVCWYALGEGDGDPHTFLAYLAAACEAALPGLAGAAALRPADDAALDWSRALDALLNDVGAVLAGPALLILDDYHFVAGAPEVAALTERLIAHAPRDLHVVLAGRHQPPAPALLRWRARGELLEIGREALAFDEAEIAALFRDIYGFALASADLAALAHQTEGWPIALQLAWQGLRGGSARGVAELLASGPASLGALVDYLASEVLGRQPPDLAAFLCDTAALRELTPAACDAVRGATDSAAQLDALRERDLFVVELGERHLRLHHLFHDFLRQQAAAAGALSAQHRRAAAHFSAAGDDAAAIEHALAAGEFGQAAAAVEQAGEAALRAGRPDTLAAWVDALPPDVIAARPLLQAFLGDLYRLRARFDEARSWYAQAEVAARMRGDRAGVAMALRGQANVFLDQVQPAQAERPLAEALRLADGDADRAAQARLLELLAENKLNMGKPGEAERLRAEARALRSDSAEAELIDARVRLRTGRLAEARAALERRAEAERAAAARGEGRPPRGHRETVLVLALVYLFQGEAAAAHDLAARGLAEGEQAGAPFVVGVAHARLGHAAQLYAPGGGAPAARDHYEQALAAGEALAAPRLRAEALWGLARLHGLAGDLAAAERAAAEGAAICQWAGDQWVAAMIDLTLGLATVLAGQAAAAVEPIERALGSFRECGDPFGHAAARLWLALAHSALRQGERAAANFDACLALVAEHGYDHLLARPSLLGPPDPRRLAPLLLDAQARGARPELAGRALAILGLAHVSLHPGYQLRVRTLGAFRVARGEQEVEAREWQRDKARQLFQLLLARRGRWLQREEIGELLWPRLSPEAAARDFKVALNALYRALEPARAPDALSAYIARDGSAYRLRPEADLWHDADAFAELCAAGAARLDSGDLAGGAARLADAVNLYGGDALPEALYDDWVAAERERLRDLFLRAADRLAVALLALGRPAEAAAVCGRILAHERCHERAYRLLMHAHAAQGNRPLAARAFLRCVEALRAELDLDPAPDTAALHDLIRRGDPLPPVTAL